MIIHLANYGVHNDTKILCVTPSCPGFTLEQDEYSSIIYLYILDKEINITGISEEQLRSLLNILNIACQYTDKEISELYPELFI